MRKSSFFVFATATRNVDGDGQALRHFALLYFGAIISSAAGVLSRVLRTFSCLKIFTKRFRQDQLVTTRRRPAGPVSHLFRIQVQFLEVSCAEAAKQQNFFFTAEVFSDQLNKAPLLRALHRPQRAWFLPPAPTATPPHFPSPGRLAPLISCDVSCCPTRFEISARIYLGMMSPLQLPPRR